MTLPWLFDSEPSARQCAASKDPVAYTPMQRISAITFLYDNAQLSDRAIAGLANIAPSSVRHHLRLAKRLDPTLCQWLHNGQLSFGHAKLLAGQPPSRQVAIAQQCVEKQWSVKALKAYLAGEAALTSASERQLYYQQLSDLMSEQIGFPVKVSVKGEGPRGKLEIQYFTLEDFETLCQRLHVDLQRL